jgi:hypothetical protein
MSPPKKVPWFEIDKAIAGLATDKPHEIVVQREAIPIIFVPGIMGSRLRRPGTNGEGEDANGLPNLRWDPRYARLHKILHEREASAEQRVDTLEAAGANLGELRS